MEELLNDVQYARMIEAVKEKYGYDFTGYATSSLMRRVSRFMLTHRISNIELLTSTLISDEATFESFVQSLSVTVTEFFRNPLFFKSLRERVVPRLATYPIIKIWIAGCATGQEVFSVAILLREAGLLERSVIYATDINQQSLLIARKGIYPAHEMSRSEVSYEDSGGRKKLSDYYTMSHDSVLLDRSLTEKVIYSPHNLATDKSFNEFQLILCRNVIMYFDRVLQDKVIELFSASLCAFGFIGLGDKESFHFSELRSVFDEVDRQQKIYRKIVPLS